MPPRCHLPSFFLNQLGICVSCGLVTREESRRSIVHKGAVPSEVKATDGVLIFRPPVYQSTDSNGST